jgi:hypothetical protein
MPQLLFEYLVSASPTIYVALVATPLGVQTLAKAFQIVAPLVSDKVARRLALTRGHQTNRDNR